MRTADAAAEAQSHDTDMGDPLPELDSGMIFSTRPDTLQSFAEDTERMARRVITLIWAYQKVWPDEVGPCGGADHVLEFAAIVTDLIGHYMHEQCHASIRAAKLDRRKKAA